MDWTTQRLKKHDGKPTDAYGELKFFSTRNNAKFVRVSSKTKQEDLNDLLFKEWKLKKPSFIISVTGSAKDFRMNSELTRKFQKSIVETAETTGAWIVTGGTNCGVMKLVGDAVQKYATSKEIVVLGIASWGIVADRGKLKNPKNQIVFYKNMEEQALNKNHTHLILVDNGTTGQFGGEISLRASLERHIAKHNQIKAMCIIVQGGPGSLETVSKALKRGTSVVVINGSGGWADVLAYLRDVNSEKINEDLVENIMKENNLEPTQKYPLEALTNMVKICVEKNDLIFVFSLDQLRGRDMHDLHKAISLSRLQSSMTTEQASENDHLNRLLEVLEKNELNIAKAYTKWNKSFTPPTYLSVLIEAIKKDNVDFTKLFLSLLKDTNETFDESTFSETTSFENAIWNAKKRTPIQFEKSIFGSQYEEDKSKLTIATVKRKLFLYALFSNKKAISQILWKEMKDKLAASVAACGALAGMSKISKSWKKEYMDHFQIYKDLTNGILSDCFSDDKLKTIQYLKLPMEKWGNLTCFRIIVNTEDEILLSHEAVQEVLNELWQGDIKKPMTFWGGVFQTLFIYIGAFTFFTIPTIVSLNNNRTFFSSGPNKVNPTDEEQPEQSFNQTRNRPTYFEQIYRFYQSPKVKFHLTFFFYLVFLILFGYILLFDFFQTVNILEWFLLGFIISLIVEEKRQLEAFSFTSWFSKPGNKLDTVGFLLYFTGFFVRLFSLIEIARVFLCLAFIVFFLRILSMFTFNKYIGPQILMIEKMIKDLFLFIFILLVFLLAYGVASQSLLYPNERNIGNVFLGVIARPYWSLYGELFLPETNYNPTSDDFTCTNDRNLIAGGHQPCPQQNVIVPIISSLYLLLANVLLINLLIAMFTYTLNKYVDKTDQIWKKQRCQLLEEYKQRSAVVIPFSLFVIFVKEIFLGKKTNTAFDFEKPLAKKAKALESMRELLKWLNKITKLYLMNKKSKEEKSEVGQIQKIRESFEMLQKKIDNIQNHLEEFQAVNEKVDRLEETLAGTMKPSNATS